LAQAYYWRKEKRKGYHPGGHCLSPDREQENLGNNDNRSLEKEESLGGNAMSTRETEKLPKGKEVSLRESSTSAKIW
jgi:hypothetical protein